ncbi:hypothetical protein BDQ17DRAFT_1261987, partial [Cyathus striatus]
HTYLDGTGSFKELSLWAVGIPHSTATLSPGGVRGLYRLRLMHRLNIYLSRLGHSGWAGSFWSLRCPNPNLSVRFLIGSACKLHNPNKRIW